MKKLTLFILFFSSPIRAELCVQYLKFQSSARFEIENNPSAHGSYSFSDGRMLFDDGELILIKIIQSYSGLSAKEKSANLMTYLNSQDFYPTLYFEHVDPRSGSLYLINSNYFKKHRDQNHTFNHPASIFKRMVLVLGL